jgi:hypothetical protein
MRCNLDIHFVNADNKQTVPKVLGAYRRMGVPCAGIVDIDVINNAQEFRKQLEAAGIDGDAARYALGAQGTIASTVNASPTEHRLERMIGNLSDMAALAKSALTANSAGQETVINQLAHDASRLKADCSAWQEVKKKGIVATGHAKVAFDKLYALCSDAGLFINPSGELESSLRDCGLEWQSDKRRWIAQAVNLVQNLQPDVSKQPWALMDHVRRHLEGRQKNEPTGEIP